MDQVFPSGFPGPTASYLSLYVVTFALHHAFMHFVLAGSVYVAWSTIFPGNGEQPRSQQPLAATLRDWMPFALSGAITAGIAPLLFIQIIYPENFYTANLLLSWRWMMVIPTLIAIFYMLYLIKSRMVSSWPFVARAALVSGVALLVWIVGYCWTANHVLSTTPDAWPDAYVTGNVATQPIAIMARMAIWFLGAFPTLAVVAAWQLNWWDETMSGSTQQADPLHTESVRLARIAILGLAGALIASLVYLAMLPETVRGNVLGSCGLAYFILAAVGCTTQLGGWLLHLRTARSDSHLDSAADLKSIISRRGLPGRGAQVILAFGCTLTLLAVSVVRETIRLSHIDLDRLYEQHAEAAKVGGLSVFAIFGVVNGLVIAYCIWLVRYATTRRAVPRRG